MTPKRPWITEEIKGEALELHGRKWLPVIKRSSMIKRQATFGTHKSNCGGGGLVWLRPIALIERQADGSEQRIAIPDPTLQALRAMFLVIWLLPVLFLLVKLLVFLRRRSKRSLIHNTGGIL